MEQVLGRTLGASEVVMHACDNPRCFRLDHLRLGTQADNMADMRVKGRAHGGGHQAGTRNPNARLTDELAVEILRLKGSGSSRQVGERYGVSGALVRDIWLRRAWRHVQV
jgi:hypothetical protein